MFSLFRMVCLMYALTGTHLSFVAAFPKIYKLLYIIYIEELVKLIAREGV